MTFLEDIMGSGTLFASLWLGLGFLTFLGGFLLTKLGLTNEVSRGKMLSNFIWCLLWGPIAAIAGILLGIGFCVIKLVEKLDIKYKISDWLDKPVRKIQR